MKLTALPSIVAAGAMALFGAPANAQSQPVPTPSTSAAPAAMAAPAPAAAAAAGDPSRGEPMRGYHSAFLARRLGSQEPMGLDHVRRRVAEAESMKQTGRNDEAASRLMELVEHPHFEPFAENDEGRAALYLLGDTLATMGAYEPARGYLQKLLMQKTASFGHATYAARAVRRLADIALETQRYAVGLEDLKSVPSTAPDEVRGEVFYLSGRAREGGDPDGAIAAYGNVAPRSRFWAQATYLAGLLHVERGRFKAGENLFCKVADPKLAEARTTPLYGDARFFAVRDLARLGLGRVAHEQARFDDARYYYYLVPRDSNRLAEALYESATSRYEKKDYQGARELLDELRSGAAGTHHAYEDEAIILDAYVDLAQCKFPDADQKLRLFLTKYEPVRDAARRVQNDGRAMQGLLAATRGGAAGGASRNVPDVPPEAGTAVSPEALAAIAALVRVDPAYGGIARRRAVLDREASGLKLASRQLSELTQQIAAPAGLRPAVIEKSGEDRSQDARAAFDGLKREIDALDAARVPEARVAPLRQELAQLEGRVVPPAPAPATAAAVPPADGTADPAGSRRRDLPDLLRADVSLAQSLAPEVDKAQRDLASAETMYARDALRRLESRLSRLLRRARLGRIESVLGKKRALEVEIEAIANGYLPSDAVDSLDAARYLRDDEEYWPFEGDDWPDEYVGNEGSK